MMKQRKSTVHDEIARMARQFPYRHAVASTLRNRKGLIEHYELYRFPQQPAESSSTTTSEQPIAVAVVKVGNQLDGPAGFVHGGIIALMFDDVVGFACVPLIKPAVTQHLAVHYKRPQPHNEYVQIRVYKDEPATQEYKTSNQKKKGKRLFLKATCSSLGTSTPSSAPFSKEDGVLYSTATVTMAQPGAGFSSSARGNQQKAHDLSYNTVQGPPSLQSRL